VNAASMRRIARSPMEGVGVMAASAVVVAARAWMGSAKESV
jgi:hypothetical protein